jgi:MFS family permease
VNARWVLACAAAETVGMAAAAGATRLADGLDPLIALGVVVAAGLVEGTALGVLQAAALRDLLDRRRRRAWALVTVVVAGLGWAAGSAPATLAGDSGGATSPPWAVILLGAAALGLAMGALLGAAQATALRGAVRHPWRWVTASAAGWTVTMTVIFVGASSAGATWSWSVLVAYGALTGAVGGAALGLVTGLWLVPLDGPPLRHRLVLRGVAARHGHAADGMTALTVTGATTGRSFRFPVMCAPLGRSSLVVLPGHPERKSWWHQLDRRPYVEVLDAGDWVPARARVIEHGSVEWSVARSAYVARWRHARISDGPLVVVDLRPALVVSKDQRPVEAGPAAVGTDAPTS